MPERGERSSTARCRSPAGPAIPAIRSSFPATAGHRPPHPPLDTVDDGGLPRHVIVGGALTASAHPARLRQDAASRQRSRSSPETGDAGRKGGDGLPCAALTHRPACHARNGSQPATLRHQRPAAGAGRAVRRSLRRRPRQRGRQRRASTRRPDIQIDVEAQQGRLALPAAAHARAVGRRQTTPRSPAAQAARAVVLPRQQRRLHRVPAHQPGAQRLRARRLPGAHADRHPRPAHPPGEVRRDLLGRLAATAGTTRTAPSRPTRCASASRHPRDQRLRRPPTPHGTFACPRAKVHPFFGAGTRSSATGSARRPRSSAGTPIRCVEQRAAPTARCAPSSPTTTSAPRPTSRSVSTPAW